VTQAIPHVWAVVEKADHCKAWRCVVCKGTLLHHRGLIESDESFEAPPQADYRGGCDLKRRISYLEGRIASFQEELTTLRAKLVESETPPVVSET
jgi:hypothetical protein